MTEPPYTRTEVAHRPNCTFGALGGKQFLGMVFEANYVIQQMANRKSANVLKLKVTTKKEMAGIFSISRLRVVYSPQRPLFIGKGCFHLNPFPSCSHEEPQYYP